MMRRRTVLAAGLGLAASPATAAAAAAAARRRPAAATAGGDFTVSGWELLLAYQGFVEQHLGGVLRALHALAQTSDVQSADWGRMLPAMRALSTESATYATMYIAWPDGAYASLAVGRDRGLTMADRPDFVRLMKGEDVEGDLVIGKSTGRHSVIVATPVVASGKVVCAIGAAIDARMLSELVIDATQPPANVTFYALDEKGENTIHKDPKQMAQFPSEFGTPSMKAAVQRMLTKTSGAETYDYQGGRRTALFNWSDATRWRFVLAQISPVGGK